MDAIKLFVIVESFRIIFDNNEAPNYYSIRRHYENINSNFKNKVISINNNINSNVYNINEILNTIIIFYLYYNNQNIWQFLTNTNIKIYSKKYYSKRNKERDSILLHKLSECKSKTMQSFFCIGESGTCIASNLLRNKYIGPEIFEDNLDCLSNIENANIEEARIINIMKEKKKWHASLIGTH